MALWQEIQGPLHVRQVDFKAAHILKIRMRAALQLPSSHQCYLYCSCVLGGGRGLRACHCTISARPRRTLASHTRSTDSGSSMRWTTYRSMLITTTHLFNRGEPRRCNACLGYHHHFQDEQQALQLVHTMVVSSITNVNAQQHSQECNGRFPHLGGAVQHDVHAAAGAHVCAGGQALQRAHLILEAHAPCMVPWAQVSAFRVMHA